MDIRRNPETGQKEALLDGEWVALIPGETKPGNQPGYISLKDISRKYAEFVAAPDSPPITTSVGAIYDLRWLIAAARLDKVCVKGSADLRPRSIETMSDEEIAECRISLADAVALLSRHGELPADEAERILATEQMPGVKNDASLPTSHANVSDKLARLNQASRKFWGNADRNDRESHPDNATVAAWLEQQGFSSTLADKAATIIRPDWAPTGRKPKE